MDVQGIHDRGAVVADSIYGSLLLRIFDTWGSHREDLKYHEMYMAYGLYLSDFSILTPIETEVVVYSAISCLGLRGPGLWHLRGIGRLLGARGPQVNTAKDETSQGIMQQTTSLRSAVLEVVKFVAQEFMDKAKVTVWASNEDVASELGGWGDD